MGATTLPFKNNKTQSLPVGEDGELDGVRLLHGRILPVPLGGPHVDADVVAGGHVRRARRLHHDLHVCVQELISSERCVAE